MLEYSSAEIAMAEGKKVRRHGWPECKVIRYPEGSDFDLLMHLDSIDGVIVQDCPKPCDCSVTVWVGSPEDKDAEDWEIVTN